MRRIGLLAAVVAFFSGYWVAVRPWHLSWGTTPEEAEGWLPGDENAPNPKVKATHAVTIEAPVEDVWPWLVQIGQRRGGFYSYTAIENLAGCKMTNAEEIVDEWQTLAPGDKVYLHPKVALKVLEVDPYRTIVLERDWSFNLRPLDGGRTRLIVRGAGWFEMPDLKLPPLNFLYWRCFYEPGHFVMERKMMLGIKERAERTVALCEREPVGAGV